MLDILKKSYKMTPCQRKPRIQGGVHKPPPRDVAPDNAQRQGQQDGSGPAQHPHPHSFENEESLYSTRTGETKGGGRRAEEDEGCNSLLSHRKGRKGFC